MKRLRWILGGVLGGVVALLVGFKVEKGGGGSLPEWLFHLDGRDYSPFPLPVYSAPYWAIGGFVIGALWVALRRHA